VDIIPNANNPVEGPIVGTQVPDHHHAPDFELALNNRDKPFNNLDNAVRVLEHYPHWRDQIWFDDFHQRIYTTFDSDTPREWQDSDDIAAMLWIQRQIIGLEKTSRVTVTDAIQIVAQAQNRDSLEEWLRQSEWDGTPRTHLLFIRGFGAEENSYTTAVSRNFMNSLAARGLVPGCQVDTAPVLEGHQGVGKSSGLRALAGPEWYAESHQDLMSKDFVINLQGKLIIEISEMDAFTRAEVERVKGVITCRSDRYRRPYGRHAHDHPRRCVFAGTTNRDDWNRDETGARRFWPIACNQVDVGWIEDNREQLFAEAVAAFNAGEQWWITDAEINEQARIEQDNRRAADTWEEPIQDYLTDRNRVKMADILYGVFGLEPSNQDMREQWRVGKILRASGWRKKVERTGDKTVKVWVRDVTPLTTDVAPLLPP